MSDFERGIRRLQQITDEETLASIREAFGPNAARRAAGVTEEYRPLKDQQTLYLSVALEIVEKDELDALREAVEVLEDMHDSAEYNAGVRLELMRHYRTRFRESSTDAAEFEEAAYEAVEVLEDLWESAQAGIRIVRDDWRTLWQQQRDECERLSGQVSELRSEVTRQQERGDELQEQRNNYADKANQYRALYESAERDIQTLKPDYDAERMIREMTRMVQRG